MKIKGVAHIHSTHSYDGKLTLSELKDLFMSAGIKFALMSEHTDYLDSNAARKFVEECELLSDEQFLFVPGFEVPYKKAHILHYGAKDFVCAKAGTEDLLRWRDVSSVVFLAHPIRNDFIVDETMLKVIDGVEVWNQQYEGKRLPRSRSIKLLKSLQKIKPGLLAIGGIDLHRTEHFGSPILEMEIDELSAESILSNARDGNYDFKNDKLTYRGCEEINLTFAQRVNSFMIISFINLGKTVNKLLAKLGFRLPKKLVGLVRGRV